MLVNLKLNTIWTQRRDISDQRLSICSTCNRYDKNKNKCLECGCFLEFKTFILSEECPIGKWTKNHIDI